MFSKHITCLKVAIPRLETVSNGISNPIGERGERIFLTIYSNENRTLIASRYPCARLRDFLGEEFSARGIDSTQRKPSVLMFIIYHGAPDCLPDDKGSYICICTYIYTFFSSRSSLMPLLFCGNACVPSHNSQMSCGLYRADTCPTYRSLLSEPLISRRCQSFQSEGLHRHATRPTCFRDKINKRTKEVCSDTH